MNSHKMVCKKWHIFLFVRVLTVLELQVWVRQLPRWEDAECGWFRLPINTIAFTGLSMKYSNNATECLKRKSLLCPVVTISYEDYEFWPASKDCDVSCLLRTIFRNRNQLNLVNPKGIFTTFCLKWRQQLTREQKNWNNNWCWRKSWKQINK